MENKIENTYEQMNLQKHTKEFREAFNLLKDEIFKGVAYCISLSDCSKCKNYTKNIVDNMITIVSIYNLYRKPGEFCDNCKSGKIKYLGDMKYYYALFASDDYLQCNILKKDEPIPLDMQKYFSSKDKCTVTCSIRCKVTVRNSKLFAEYSLNNFSNAIDKLEEITKRWIIDKMGKDFMCKPIEKELNSNVIDFKDIIKNIFTIALTLSDLN